MSRFRFRAVVAVAAMLTACLVATGCACERMIPRDDAWTLQAGDGGGTATMRIGDVEASVRPDHAAKGFPVEVTLRNFGATEVPVTIEPPPGRRPSDVVRWIAPRIPPKSGESPGLLRVALSDEPCELIAHAPDGDARFPVNFDVSTNQCCTVAKDAGNALLAILVIAAYLAVLFADC